MKNGQWSFIMRFWRKTGLVLEVTTVEKDNDGKFTINGFMETIPDGQQKSFTIIAKKPMIRFENIISLIYDKDGSFQRIVNHTTGETSVYAAGPQGIGIFGLIVILFGFFVFAASVNAALIVIFCGILFLMIGIYVRSNYDQHFNQFMRNLDEEFEHDKGVWLERKLNENFGNIISHDQRGINQVFKFYTGEKTLEKFPDGSFVYKGPTGEKRFRNLNEAREYFGG